MCKFLQLIKIFNFISLQSQYDILRITHNLLPMKFHYVASKARLEATSYTYIKN